MNQYERRPYDAGEAEVEYLDGDFKVRRPGAYVRCAVTRQPIPLEDAISNMTVIDAVFRSAATRNWEEIDGASL